MLELSGKVFAITGASAGIGKAAAELFSRQGATVALLARRASALEKVAADLDGPSTVLPCDVSDPAAVRSAFARIDGEHGGLDGLLNVAGVARIRSVDEASDDDLQLVLGVNLLGPMYTTREAVPLLRAAGGGDIVNVSSEITQDTLPLMAHYGASKAGLERFSIIANGELKRDGIRVSVLVAGATNTEFGTNFEPEQKARAKSTWSEDGYLSRIAGTRMDPSWMAEALLFQVTRPRGQMVEVLHARSSG